MREIQFQKIKPTLRVGNATSNLPYPFQVEVKIKNNFALLIIEATKIPIQNVEEYIVFKIWGIGKYLVTLKLQFRRIKIQFKIQNNLNEPRFKDPNLCQGEIRKFSLFLFFNCFHFSRKFCFRFSLKARNESLTRPKLQQIINFHTPEYTKIKVLTSLRHFQLLSMVRLRKIWAGKA